MVYVAKANCGWSETTNSLPNNLQWPLSSIVGRRSYWALSTHWDVHIWWGRDSPGPSAASSNPGACHWWLASHSITRSSLTIIHSGLIMLIPVFKQALSPLSPLYGFLMPSNPLHFFWLFQSVVPVWEWKILTAWIEHRFNCRLLSAA